MAHRVVCYACGRTDEFPAKRCSCGEPLWFETDPSGFDWPDAGDRSLWRYADLLPTSPPPGVGSTAGGTPLFRAGGLDAFAGARVWLKSEVGNVTGSFKDRGSAVGVAWADGRRDWVGTVSHGNMAMSMAAHAAAAGLGCVVLVPEDIPRGRLSHLARFDPEIVRVSGSYGRLYYDALDAGPDLGIAFVNSDTPLRVAGQKTTGLEILEAVAPDSADAIVLPVSSGGHASAIWKALREVDAAGLVDDLPRLYLVQAAACDPIATAFREGADAVGPVEAGDTIAYSIANDDPPSGTRALAAARETGGAVVSVDDDATREAGRRLAADAGLYVEPSSAVALAGLRVLAGEGAIRPDEDAVVVATGSGFKESGEVDVETAATERGALASELPAILGRRS